MGILFKNRLSGEMTATPEREAFLGEWIISEKDSEAFLNVVPINSGDFLIPNTNAQWSLLNKEDGQQQSGIFDKYLLPEDIEAASIRVIGESLSNLNWLEWIDVSPLVPGMSERVEIQPLEQEIRKHIGHLEQIFRKPKAHLWTEIERVQVSRAKRIPHQAANYLAAHTEDWERQTLRGVLPKRILAMVTEDYWNIYENQVAVRLTDHLHAYLSRRVTEVRRLLNIFKEVGDYSGNVRGTHWLQKRICDLWGKSFDENAGNSKAEVTLKELKHLKYKIAGLKNTFLYREIPRRASVSNTLRMTNILVDDPHYHHLAILWKEWLEKGSAKTKTPEQLYKEYQNLCRSFDSFCFLLTVRAFDQLKFEPSDFDLETPIKKGTNLSLFSSFCKTTLTWNDDGIISVEKDGSPVLRLIPLVSALGVNPTSATAERYLDDITESVSTDPLTIILYLPSPEGRENRLPVDIQGRLHTIGNDLPQKQKKVGFLPVSPWEIGSVERVARAIRWVLWGSEFLKYPPEIDVPATINLPQNSEWMKPVSGGKYKVLRLPKNGEESVFELDKFAKQLNSEKNQCEQDLANVDKNSQKLKGLKKQIADVKDKLKNLDQFKKEFQKIKEDFNRLLDCPISTCSGKVSNAFKYDEQNDSFACTCPVCKADWGIKICNSCERRFPFLCPQLPDDNEHHTVHHTVWVDQSIGMDVLAPQHPLTKNIICPDCG